MKDPARLTAAARTGEGVTLVITGAQVFNVFLREWQPSDVLVCDQYIAAVLAPGSHVAKTAFQNSGVEVVDATGKWLTPGYIDAHVHIESSMLTPARFSEVVVPLGTTTVVCEPHEIANVLGTAGVDWFLNASSDLPLDCYVMAPSCVPASAFESPHTPINATDIAEMLEHERVLGIGEMMNFPGVISGATSEIAKLLERGNKHVDGHAPGVSGEQLNAYVAAGITSDHEATTWQEALEKRSLGMWVLLREASNARNLTDLLELVRRYGPDFCAFCTDDRDPAWLARHGHIDQMLRTAVTEGISTEDALVLATLHPARAHRLESTGAIAPGFLANLNLLDCIDADKSDGFVPTHVWHHGNLVARGGSCLDPAVDFVPQGVVNTVNIAPTKIDDLLIHVENSEGQQTGSINTRVIGLIADQLLTTSEVVSLAISPEGAIQCDSTSDILHISVVERHHATGRVGNGFVRGFGIPGGALASTVAHDAHNLVVAGSEPALMLACIKELERIGGGLAVCKADGAVSSLPLEVGGLMSSSTSSFVIEKLEDLHSTLREMGTDLDAPFMALSFLALSVIPSLKVTDQGLVDVDAFEIVDPVVHAPLASRN